MGNHPSTGAPGAAGAREIAKAESGGRTGEPLEAFRKEKERDDHLKNLGFKRSKSLRKSISKRLKRHKKHEDVVDVGPNDANRSEPDPSAAVELSSAASKPKRSSSNERVERIDPPRRRPLVGEPQPLPTHVQDSLDDQHRPRRMDRLRKSLRSSMRKKKHRDEPEAEQPKSSTGGGKPQLWSNDEAAVRSGTCSFHVKYLGCVEVFESRGMQVCEEAIKVLKNSKRKSVRAIFYVHGDGLRVVDAETKGLIVDQTIEKVSFCAPDRNFEKGFSYICRDGTTRRWMCHGFMSNRDSGERLSHAVGCAFAICLERKQKRDKECSVTMTYDSTNSSFTRFGSFRQATITERLQDPQGFKGGAIPKTEAVTPEDKQFAIARPHATDLMLQRQTSFRGFGQLGGNSPFKRNLSLRLSDLPSNLERRANQPGGEKPSAVMPVQQLKAQLNTLYKMSENNNNTNGRVSPIPENHPSKDEDISAMCQQLSHGLSLLNAQDFQNHDSQHEQPHSLPALSPLPPVPEHESPILQPEKPDPLANVQPVQYDNPWDFVPDQTKYSGAPQGLKPSSNCDSSSGVSSSASTSNGGVASDGGVASLQTPDWLTTNGVLDGKKSPTHSLGSASSKEWNAEFWSKDPFDTSAAILDDPFDAEWAALATRNSSRNEIQSPTNPFKESGMKAFELQM